VGGHRALRGGAFTFPQTDGAGERRRIGRALELGAEQIHAAEIEGERGDAHQHREEEDGEHEREAVAIPQSMRASRVSHGVAFRARSNESD